MSDQAPKQALILVDGHVTVLYPESRSLGMSRLPEAGVSMMNMIALSIKKNEFTYNIAVILNKFSDQIKESFRNLDSNVDLKFSEHGVLQGSWRSAKNTSKFFRLDANSLKLEILPHGITCR